MNSDNTSFKNLLQSGDSRAIAQFLNKGFAAGGVKVAQCDRQGSTLRMLLVGEKIDQQQKHAIDFLQKQLTQLEIQGISQIIIEGQKPDSMMPVWHEEITLLPDSISEPLLLTFEDEMEESPPPLPQPMEEPPPLPRLSSTERPPLPNSQNSELLGKSKIRRTRSSNMLMQVTGKAANNYYGALSPASFGGKTTLQLYETRLVEKTRKLIATRHCEIILSEIDSVEIIEEGISLILVIGIMTIWIFGLGIIFIVLYFLFKYKYLIVRSQGNVQILCISDGLTMDKAKAFMNAVLEQSELEKNK